MVVPIGNQAREQFRLAEEGRIGRGCSAHHKMVAATGASVFSVEREFFGAQMLFKRRLIQKFRVLDEFVPVVRRVNIHLDDTGVWRDLQKFQSRVARRRIAFEHEFDLAGLSGSLNRCEQIEIILQHFCGRHEDIQNAAACFYAQCRARKPMRGLEASGHERGCGGLVRLGRLG